MHFQQAEHFCNSVGILQQFSTPSKFPGFDRVSSTPQHQTQEGNNFCIKQQWHTLNFFICYCFCSFSPTDYASLFATLIARCAKDIDTLIESLPSEESSQELQVQSLSRLEQENHEAGEQLEEVVRQGEGLLQRIQAALQDIAQSQLDMQNPTSSTVINSTLNLNISQECLSTGSSSHSNSTQQLQSTEPLPNPSSQ